MCLQMNGEYPPQKLHSPQGDMICSPASRGTQQLVLQHEPGTLQPQGSSDAIHNNIIDVM